MWGKVPMRTLLYASILFTLPFTFAWADTPCDFKEIAVGDKMRPAEIMSALGIRKFEDDDAPIPKQRQQAEFDARMERAAKVGITNASEEEAFKRGPVCGKDFCRVPYGVTVGNEPYPQSVSVFVSFGQQGLVTAIDVFFDKANWDGILELLNSKFGDGWDQEENETAVIDYQTKKSQLETVLLLTHRKLERNARTGDKCSIRASSRDIVFLHTTSPINRGFVEIKLMSKNF